MQDKDDRQKQRLKKARFIAGVIWFAAVGLAFYTLYENFCPSELVYNGAYFGWILGGVAYFFLLETCSFRKTNRPRLALYAWWTLALFFSLYFARTTMTWGLPAVANRIVGEPFQAETVVIRKYTTTRSCKYKIEVADYKTSEGSVCSTEEVWKQVYKGASVNVSGVRSSWGETIDMVIPTAPAPSGIPGGTSRTARE